MTVFLANKVRRYGLPRAQGALAMTQDETLQNKNERFAYRQDFKTFRRFAYLPSERIVIARAPCARGNP